MTRLNRSQIAALLNLIGAFYLAAFSGPSQATEIGHLDESLGQLIAQHELKPIYADIQVSPEQAALGQALFFDMELSGSRDVACATCHHPNHNAGDDLSLSIGVGGSGLGYGRTLGTTRRLVPRNAPEIFNRGNTAWRTMNWDGRVEITPDGRRVSPADDKLPEALESVLAIQAMFPLTSRDEMRGRKGDSDRLGEPNRIAAVDDRDFEGMWKTVMSRILAIPEYADWFARVYPNVLP